MEPREMALASQSTQKKKFLIGNSSEVGMKTKIVHVWQETR